MWPKSEEPSSGLTILFALSVVVILAVSAVCSGLNIGLISISELELKTVETNGDVSKRRAARRLRRIMEDRYLLLCSILIFNAIAMGVLPLLLDILAGPTVAVILSITLLLLCGEIIPQAICDKYGLEVGAFCLPLLWTFIFTTFAASYPLARFLDHIIGCDDVCYYTRSEISEMLEMHAETGEKTQSKAGGDKLPPLKADEVRYIQGVMKASEKTVMHCLTPIEDVYMLPCNAPFDKHYADEILEHKHSEIPLYNPETNTIVSILKTKRLLEIDPRGGIPLCLEHICNKVVLLPNTTTLFDALHQLESEKNCMAIVTQNNESIGIVTLNDVVEEILEHELIDGSGV